MSVIIDQFDVVPTPEGADRSSGPDDAAGRPALSIADVERAVRVRSERFARLEAT